MSKLDKALKLGSYHFKIHPLKPNSKLPLLKGWQEKATDDLNQIAAWWREYPDANIGIATGGNLVVLDIDNKNDKDGSGMLKIWQQVKGPIPETLVVATPNNGYHYYYRVNEELYNRVDAMMNLSGIDIRGKGGYVVGPYSEIDGKEYKVVNNTLPRPANESVIGLCKANIHNKEEQNADFPHHLKPAEIFAEKSDIEASDISENIPKDTEFKQAEAFNTDKTQQGNFKTEAFNLPEKIPEGTRDNTLFKYACSLQAQGYSDNEISEKVHKVNEERCQPMLPTKEVDTKISSALRYEKGEKIEKPKKVEKPKNETDEKTSQPPVPFVVKRGIEIEKRDTEWLWHPYIPMGKLTLLTGDPGTGKTFFCCWLASCISQGLDPEDNPFLPQQERANVVIFNAEDSPEDTLVKRLEAVNADLNYILFPSESLGTFSPFTFTDSRVEEIIKTHRPRLVIFDPIQAYIGADMNRADVTRPVMNHLANIAYKYNTAIVIVQHLNKRTSEEQFYRGMGSQDIVGAVRSRLFLGLHPKDEEVKVLFQNKNNLAAFGRPIAYRIKNGVFSIDNSVDVTNLEPDDCTSHRKKRECRDTQKNFIQELIEEAFEGRDEVPVAELKDIAEANGIKWDYFAKQRPVDVKTASKGYGKDKEYYWVCDS